ncbi:hypothetical protein LCGC14_2133250 [marine sediment metagenome]|uniref:Uncharacterized protein n=1 Tax=marine sediment metagenome TaxID=412755 RepID=A0A0F9GDS1_9ZZZZ
MSNFIIFVCTVCGETIKHLSPSTYSPNITHNHVDENGQEYYIQMIQVYPLADLATKKNDSLRSRST